MRTSPSPRPRVRAPDRFIERGNAARSADATVGDGHAVIAKPCGLVVETWMRGRKRDAPIAAHDTVPRKRPVIVNTQHACDLAGAAGKTRASRDVAISGHLATRDRADRGMDAMQGLVVRGHGASIAIRSRWRGHVQNLEQVRRHLVEAGYHMTMQDGHVLCV